MHTLSDFGEKFTMNKINSRSSAPLHSISPSLGLNSIATVPFLYLFVKLNSVNGCADDVDSGSRTRVI